VPFKVAHAVSRSLGFRAVSPFVLASGRPGTPRLRVPFSDGRFALGGDSLVDKVYIPAMWDFVLATSVFP